MGDTWVRSLGQEDPPEEEMATHSSILAWRIPRTEEPGEPRSRELQRVGRTEATDLAHTCCVWTDVMVSSYGAFTPSPPGGAGTVISRLWTHREEGELSPLGLGDGVPGTEKATAKGPQPRGWKWGKP